MKTKLKSKAQFMDKQQTPATLEGKLGNLAQFSWQLPLIMRQVPWIVMSTHSPINLLTNSQT